MEAVLNSKVGVTITGFLTKLQLQAKKLERMSENEISKKGKCKRVHYSNYIFSKLVSNKCHDAKQNFINEKLTFHNCQSSDCELL